MSYPSNCRRELVQSSSGASAKAKWSKSYYSVRESNIIANRERKYSQTKKEALALVWSCEHFHVYLYDADFDLLTDYKALEFIFSSRSKPSARIGQWMLRLQPYRYKVIHIVGSKNIADSLS